MLRDFAASVRAGRQIRFRIATAIALAIVFTAGCGIKGPLKPAPAAIPAAPPASADTASPPAAAPESEPAAPKKP